MYQDDFEEYLNMLYVEIDICGFKYPAGAVFREIDYKEFVKSYEDWLEFNDLELEGE